jgi:thiol-disulfide isomerase/thioredoxin
MNIDKRLLGVFIPCTEHQAEEVYKLLERAGLKVFLSERNKLWCESCNGVKTYLDGTFNSSVLTYPLPTLTIEELRQIVNEIANEANDLCDLTSFLRGKFVACNQEQFFDVYDKLIANELKPHQYAKVWEYYYYGFKCDENGVFYCYHNEGRLPMIGFDELRDLLNSKHQKK